MTSLIDHLSVIAHADWSVNSGKRWMASAVRTRTSQLTVAAPVKVLEPGNMLGMLCEESSTQGAILVGFDFPIGLPLEYARRAGIDSYLKALPLFGAGDWVDFFNPARAASEISLYRPFYPKIPGGARRCHLEEKLTIPFSQLYRQCERATPDRRAACPLFWTLGGQQVGKAAIAGWLEVLQPAMRNLAKRLSIWPFSGRLDDLLKPGKIIAAETYPAEFYPRLKINFSISRRGTKSGKRSQQDRAANADGLFAWSYQHSIHLDSSLVELIEEGFGPAASGEDPFDAVVGLFGMIDAMENWRSAYEPEEGELRTIEGWILGMSRTLPSAEEPARR